MKTYILPAVRILLVFTLLTGIIYPVGITFLSTLFFPYRANGSMVEKNGNVIGSELIGQNFAGSNYFHSRPSAIAYNPIPSGATNWGPTDTRMADSVRARREQFLVENALPTGTKVPQEMLFASASGVDPHISPEAALLQAERIAKARGLTNDRVTQLIQKYTEKPQFRIFGEPRVNVLKLNLALDQL